MKLWKAMVLSGFLCLLLSWTGILVSFFTDLPTGSSIAVLSGSAYLMALGVKTVISKG
jgi:ABC-type Mn2+/Zn2+ transport system permease subunit